MLEEIRRGGTVIQATPVSWQMLVEAGWGEGEREEGGGREIKVLCGGEALKEELGRKLVERGQRAWNLYGPTETTIWSLVEELKKEAMEKGGIRIGKPIGNTQVYVLDQRMGVVPVGVGGELYIGGAGVARGYLNRAELTAERFVPNPFSGGMNGGSERKEGEERKEGGERLYRTGDRVRWGRDGKLEFMGRMDEQVKVRGYRIEPGEIEGVLREHGGVKEAVVVVREGEGGDKRLVGYVVVGERGEGKGRVTGQELKSYVRERLPEYMVPGAVVMLEKLPLTPNGKVDRKALPRPEWKSEADKYVGPHSGTEEVLAQIWAEVLGVEKIGRHDNFFELGGDSILGIQVIARANEAGLRLTLKRLFEYQTIADLARVAGDTDEIHAEQGTVQG